MQMMSLFLARNENNSVSSANKYSEFRQQTAVLLASSYVDSCFEEIALQFEGYNVLVVLDRSEK